MLVSYFSYVTCEKIPVLTFRQVGVFIFPSFQLKCLVHLCNVFVKNAACDIDCRLHSLDTSPSDHLITFVLIVILSKRCIKEQLIIA